MMKAIILLFVWSCSLFIQPVFALDPGTAQGSLQVGDETISLTNSYAQLHDNAEGLLDYPKELRILLVDRSVSQDALAGIAFLPVHMMAKEGRIRGLLLQLDPSNPKHMVVTLLFRPPDPQLSLLTQTISSTGKQAIKDFKISEQRASGEIEHRDEEESQFEDIPKLAYAVRFSAPLFLEPSVTADLKGKAAANSPQLQLLRERVRAIGKGDWEAVKRMSTENSNRQIDLMLAQMGGEARSIGKQMASEMESSIRRVQRVVVRGDRAVAIFPNKQWSNFVLESGKWKSDD